MLTSDQLKKIMSDCPSAKLELFAPYLNSAMTEGDISTVVRGAAFLAQLAHESNQLQWWEEIADGSRYEGRADLGNTVPGYGRKYKGHGPIQITGYKNHKACGEALGLDLVTNPRLLCLPENGFRGSVWFWTSHGLNAVADQMAFRQVTFIVNGGYNGYENRLAFYRRSLEVLGVTAKRG